METTGELLMNLPLEVLDTMISKIDLLRHAEQNNTLVGKLELTGSLTVAEREKIKNILQMNVENGLTLFDFCNTAYQFNLSLIDIRQLEQFLFGFRFVTDQ